MTLENSRLPRIFFACRCDLMNEINGNDEKRFYHSPDGSFQNDGGRDGKERKKIFWKILENRRAFVRFYVLYYIKSEQMFVFFIKNMAVGC